MTSLVERLRKEADWLVSCACGNIPDDARLWIDAADEIERLQAALREIRDYVETSPIMLESAIVAIADAALRNEPTPVPHSSLSGLS